MKIDFATLYGSHDRPLARAFAWLTRAGIGRKFGSLPIGWYQMHQCAGLDVVKERAQKLFPGFTAFEIRATARGIEGKPLGMRGWQRLGWAQEMFTETDRRARA